MHGDGSTEEYTKIKYNPSQIIPGTEEKTIEEKQSPGRVEQK